MKSGILFFILLFTTLHITTVRAGDSFGLHPADSLASGAEAVSFKMHTAKQDSFSVNRACSFFQISRPQTLPDSLIHTNTHSFFGGLLPKTKRDYTRRGLVVTAILSNWASFYLKRQADNYYGKYQRAASLKNIHHYYDKTAEFDRYSNAMLIVSGVALSAYLYFLFSDR